MFVFPLMTGQGNAWVGGFVVWAIAKFAIVHAAIIKAASFKIFVKFFISFVLFYVCFFPMLCLPFCRTSTRYSSVSDIIDIINVKILF
jgi:hypothetical protein